MTVYKDLPRQTYHADSDSDSDEQDLLFPKIEVDPATLTPLSPEVISKQVCRTTTPLVTVY